MTKHSSNIFSDGKKIHFTNEKLPYIVMAVSDRYAVVVRKLHRRQDASLLHDRVRMSAYLSFTEAYNCNKDTAVYSLIDFKENKRSSDNLVFGIFDYFKEEEQSSIWRKAKWDYRIGILLNYLECMRTGEIDKR